MVLRNLNTGEFYKGINPKTNEMEFTTSRDEAKYFINRWYASTRINFLKYHFPDKMEIISNLEPSYEY